MSSNNNNNRRNNRRIEKEAAEIESIIKQTQNDTCAFLLSVIESLVKEQIIAKQLEKSVGVYIVNAVRDQAERKGWLNNK